MFSAIGFKSMAFGSSTNNATAIPTSAERKIIAAAEAALQLSKKPSDDDDDDDDETDIIIHIDKFASTRKLPISGICDDDEIKSPSNFKGRVIQAGPVQFFQYTKALKTDGAAIKGPVPGREGRFSSSINSVSTGQRSVNIINQQQQQQLQLDTRDDDSSCFLELDDDSASETVDEINSTKTNEAQSKNPIGTMMMSMMMRSFQQPTAHLELDLSRPSSSLPSTSASCSEPITFTTLSDKLKSLQQQLIDHTLRGYNTSPTSIVEPVDSDDDDDELSCSMKKQVPNRADQHQYSKFKSKLRSAKTSAMGTGIASGDTTPSFSVQFNDTVVVVQYKEERPTEIEKRIAWYNQRDYIQFQTNDKALVKFVRACKNKTICGLSQLLSEYEECIKTMVVPNDDNGNIYANPGALEHQQVCIRGLENVLTKQSKIDCKGRRYRIVQTILAEQREQHLKGIRRKEGANDLLRKHALAISKPAKQMAKKTAQHDCNYVMSTIYPDLLKQHPKWRTYLHLKYTIPATSSKKVESKVANNTSASTPHSLSTIANLSLSQSFSISSSSPAKNVSKSGTTALPRRNSITGASSPSTSTSKPTIRSKTIQATTSKSSVIGTKLAEKHSRTMEDPPSSSPPQRPPLNQPHQSISSSSPIVYPPIISFCRANSTNSNRTASSSKSDTTTNSSKSTQSLPSTAFAASKTDSTRMKTSTSLLSRRYK